MKRFSVLGLPAMLTVLGLALLMNYLIGGSHVANLVAAAAKSSEVSRAQSAVAQLNASSNWVVEVVDTVEGTNRYVSLALDKANRPHIAYFDPMSENLKYARLNGTVWQTETVDAQGLVGWYASLALDEFDRPHISYYDYTNADLKYAWHNGSMWQTEIVDSMGNVGSNATLALDQSNRPHISYYDSTDHTVMHAWYSGTTWQTEVIDTVVFVPREISLAITGSNQPRVSYNSCYLYHCASCEVKYAWRDGAQWQKESVAYSQFLALALDGLDQPHLSYSDVCDWPPGFHTASLQYSWRDQIQWHPVTLESVAGQVALALDKADHPHILNYDMAHRVLQYRWYDGITWHSEDVENVGIWDFYDRPGSLALDVAGRPHIAYYDAVTHQLKYAQRWPMALSKEAGPQDGLYQGDTLNYTLTFDAPGLHVNLKDPLPSGITYVSDSISSTLSSPAIYSPAIHAVIWEGTLPSNTTQAIHFQVIANGIDTGSLSLPIVNTAWLSDTDNSRSILATVIINGFKLYLPVLLKD
jgi:uncharacterized repeat protein (TIGR01451 family)